MERSESAVQVGALFSTGPLQLKKGQLLPLQVNTSITLTSSESTDSNPPQSFDHPHCSDWAITQSASEIALSIRLAQMYEGHPDQAARRVLPACMKEVRTKDIGARSCLCNFQVQCPQRAAQLR